MRLAIIGDTHYTNAAYHKEALAGRSRSPTARVDVSRHVWTTEHVLPRLVEQVRAARPDLVLQLGDTNQGHCDDDAGDVAELHEALDFFRQIGRPLLFARGTHEGRPNSPAAAAYRERYLAEIARTIGAFDRVSGANGPRERSELTTRPSCVHHLDTSYALRAEGLCLIVLDYTSFTRDGPADVLLRDALAGVRSHERVFVCGHPPLVPVGRPFFTRLEYATTVLERIAAASAPVDAYFCGHTHNQVATLHQVLPGGGWLPQLQGAPVGYPDQPPVPLRDVHPLLPPAERVRYGWGYLEDSYPGWFLVDVDASGVRARWQMIDREGDFGEVCWSEAGTPEFVSAPPGPAPVPLPEWPLAAGDPRAQSVRLRAAGMGSRAPHRIRLNGQDAGTLPVLEYFDARQGLLLPEALWPALRDENQLAIEPAAAEERCLGGFVLEVTLADGRVARSVPDVHLYATSGKWDAWRWCTPGLRQVDPGATLRLPLSFADASTSARPEATAGSLP